MAAKKKVATKIATTVAKKAAKKAVKKVAKKVAKKAAATATTAATGKKSSSGRRRVVASAQASGGAAIDGTQRALRASLGAMKVPELKERLRANDQIVTGSKSELIDRVADGITNGALPRCPQCGLGRLRVSKWGGYYCPGGYDDDEYEDCRYKVREDELERVPWVFGSSKIA